ncbi:hypothetical protein C8F01DRAFT_1252404 [Mycena amicta]|nr:hypothetical protein C8F01DRAFT_1252404 [Mycena amicta]
MPPQQNWDFTGQGSYELPPPAPRLRTIPLPPATPYNSSRSTPIPPYRPADVLPVNLLADPVTIDLTTLARVLPSRAIPPHTIIYIVPTTNRECTLLQLPTGDTPTTASAIVGRMQRFLRTPLASDDYFGLSPVAKRAVYLYFMGQAPSGREGEAARRWEDFLDGVVDPRGPKSDVLLRGHTLMWGFSRDYRGRWVIDVDIPSPDAVRTTTLQL